MKLKYGQHHIVYLLICLWAAKLITPSPVHAYLEPGTGSYFTQVVIATLLGGLVTLKIWWRKVRKRIRNRLTNDQEIN